MKVYFFIFGVFLFLTGFAPWVETSEAAYIAKLDSLVRDSIMQESKSEIITIVLKRRNWENHGTDLEIDRYGKYNVSAIYLGKKELIRKDTLSNVQRDTITDLIKSSCYLNFKDEYDAPFKTEFSWWGYELTIKTNETEKSIRFHSEDNYVPKKLKDIIELLLRLTK